MKILHISNGFADSKVHSNFAKELDKLGLEQTVYCPVREESLIGGNRFEGNNINFVYSFCIKSWYKYFYHLKRWMLYKDLKKNVDISKYDMIHAPTLFSDGGIALKAFEEYGIPYVVAVRNTDVNVFIKRLRHTYKTGRKIVLHSSRIVFISKGEMDEFMESKFIAPIKKHLKEKIILQPNGIDDFWHKHISHEKYTGHNILYIGDYSDNKNIVRLAQAVLKLRQEKGYEDARLVIVGGEKKGGDRKYTNGTQQIISEHPEAINALGEIFDKNKLLEVMRSCAVFAMPSIHETFGLVYIEALSQNLPVIYSKRQGIDGMFDQSVGKDVDPLSVDSIYGAIKQIIEHYDMYNNKHVNFDNFNWEVIAQKYIAEYKQIIEK